MADDVIATSPSAEQRKSVKHKAQGFRDLTGMVFSYLTVVDRADNRVTTGGQTRVYWNCICECGNKVVVRSDVIFRGQTKSCGCLHSLITRKIHKNNLYRLKHGQSRSPEYRSWASARKRVTDKSCPSYQNYGGRGIFMESRWLDSFESFYNDMGDRPKNTTLDRIDNDGPYSAKNCRWSTKKEQARNRRSNVFIEINGEKKTLAEWSEISGVSSVRIWMRMNRDGWSGKKAVFTPLRSK